MAQDERNAQAAGAVEANQGGRSEMADAPTVASDSVVDKMAPGNPETSSTLPQ